MTVKELQAILDTLPDDLNVILHHKKSEHWYEPISLYARMSHSVILEIKTPVDDTSQYEF